ncbi:MAG: DUF4878 domain-containing protein [Cyanobacteria bacterium CRU_2_1]|nr:DUF4878 domain-containing protein [Cyanobacteria bacterium RU_5_0]NJR57646.1 DUF4878 domain-containing protein [Cyanobacteria bacterium CRU_2_1]
MKRRHLLLIGLAIGGSLLLNGCFGSGPSKTVRQFFTALEEGDSKKINDLLSSSAQFGGVSSAILSKASAAIKASGGIQEVKINDESVTGDSARVTYTIKFKNGQQEDGTAQLVKEDREWKINSL